MKEKKHNPFLQILNNRKGVSAILVAILLPVLIGFAALAIDVGYMYATKSELQNIADASALAGAGELGRIYLDMPITQHHNYVLTTNDEQSIKDAAKLIALENYAAGMSIEILESDIYVGRWDFAETDPALRFKNNEMPPVAVRVDARRDSIMNNPVSTFFARIFGGGSDEFQSSARATAALSGPNNIEEGVLKTPFAISRNHSCGSFISFSPSPSSCAGWHNYFDTPANTSAIREKMYNFIKDHPEGTAWLSNHAGNVSATAMTPPEVYVGESLEFIGGNLAALFNGFYYSDWTDKDTPVTTSEEGQGNSYSPFFALFDFFRFRDNDNDGSNTIDVCGTQYHPDDVWTSVVPVYDESPGGCINPNQDNKIVTFATVHIVMPYPPPNTNIEVCLTCYPVVEPGRGGGGLMGTVIGSIPSLVE